MEGCEREREIKLTSREDGQFETHGVVLEGNQEQQPKYKNGPNDHVGQDARWQAMCPHHRCAVPQNSDKCPRQRARHHGDMHEARGGRVAQVERRQIEEVHDERRLGNPEASVHP